MYSLFDLQVGILDFRPTDGLLRVQYGPRDVLVNVDFGKSSAVRVCLPDFHWKASTFTRRFRNSGSGMRASPIEGFLGLCCVQGLLSFFGRAE